LVQDADPCKTPARSGPVSMFRRLTAARWAAIGGTTAGKVRHCHSARRLAEANFTPSGRPRSTVGDVCKIPQLYHAAGETFKGRLRAGGSTVCRLRQKKAAESGKNLGRIRSSAHSIPALRFLSEHKSHELDAGKHDAVCQDNIIAGKSPGHGNGSAHKAWMRDLAAWDLRPRAPLRTLPASVSASALCG
jgi:hypothetical protein